MAERLPRRLARAFRSRVTLHPPGLYREDRPDLFTIASGIGVSQLVSTVMRLGGNTDPPSLATRVNRVPARIVDRRVIARDDDVVALTLAAADGAPLPRWHAGAHVDLHLPSGRMRHYSLCGDPGDRYQYRVAVRLIPDGGGGSKEVHGLRVGQFVDLSGPRNAFLMPIPGAGSRAERLRFVAGGIGVTGVLQMVRTADRAGVPWSMFYSGRHIASMPFLDELLRFGDRVRVHSDAEHGLPRAADLLDGVDARTAVYVCGPPTMIDVVRSNLGACAELHTERFSAPPIIDGLPFEVELARSGDVVNVGADQTALAALRTARPDVSFSCQRGFCGTCVQHVLSGEVDHRDTRLTAGQRAEGQILVCVSRAESEGMRLVLDL